jgi:ABC-type bacteriocin/lantibiotic exporter with double-glycine peptidase domain
MVGPWAIRGLLLAITASGPFTASADEPSPKPGDNGDMVCGPRCVRFVLRRYGRDVELIDLVKEMQWPDLEAGASLDRIQKSLNDRGVHTSAIQFAPDRRLRWPHPAILFIAGTDGQRGHYVVRVPDESSDDELIWSGLEGWRRGRWDQVTSGFSGVALLTSPDPIADASSAVGPVSASRLARCFALGTTVALLAHIIVRLSARWRPGVDRPSPTGPVACNTQGELP